jgi:tryptophan synthase alpha subunit
MNTLTELLKVKPRKLLMTHMIVGFPDINASAHIADDMIRAGADILEMQIPFSDPMADGPTIAAVCQIAVEHAPSPHDTFELAHVLAHRHPATPLVVMCYGNSIIRYGIEAFVKDATANHIAGLIIPDIPLDTEEGSRIVAAARAHEVHIIPVISPGVTAKRLKAILPLGSGFIYCTSRQGTTGKQASLEGVREYLKTIGIATPEDVSNVHGFASIAIAGSVFVKLVQNGHTGDISKKIREMRAPTL